MATRRQRVLQDTITAIRHGLPLAECGAHLFRNGQRHLRTRRALANIHASVAGGQALMAAAVELERRCTFNLRKVKYDYPAELVPKGETQASHLRKHTETGMSRRWQGGAPAQVVRKLADEQSRSEEHKSE